MTSYSTQNPLGSADPRDLYDNAENLDELVNSQDKLSHPDRRGVSRKTWHGMEEEFDADQTSREQEFRTFIASSGYQFVGDYAAGIEITEYNQVVRDGSGEFWRLSGSAGLPYTTTGAGLPEGGAFVAVGDAVLRQELNSPNGGSIVGVTTSTGTQTVAGALDGRVGISDSSVVYNIPTDYPDLQTAIDSLSRLKSTESSNIELNIEAGHALTDGIHVENGDFSNFVITASDPVVYLSASFPNNRSIVWAEHASAPSLGCLIDMEGKGNFGYVLRSSSRGRALPECGVHGGDVNLQVWEASTIDARSTSWQNAISKDWGRNAWISSASTADMQRASNLSPRTNCSGAEVRNVYVSRRSLLNFADGISSNSQTDYGLYVIRSSVCCSDATLDDNAKGGVVGFASSVIDARRIHAVGNGTYGVWAESATNMALSDADVSESGEDNIRSTRGATIDISGTTALLAGQYALNAKAGGHITSLGPVTLSGVEGERNTRADGYYTINTQSNIINSYTSQNGQVITKRIDGSMEIEIPFMEFTYDHSRRLGGSVEFDEPFAQRPHTLLAQGYHSEITWLPGNASVFNEYVDTPMPSFITRVLSPYDAVVYAVSPAGDFTESDNGYACVVVKGRWLL